MPAVEGRRASGRPEGTERTKGYDWGSWRGQDLPVGAVRPKRAETGVAQAVAQSEGSPSSATFNFGISHSFNYGIWCEPEG